ncbi:hypothetical protein GE09DRAFT_1279251 [Coniochaeta sp. 2T2.1]|nr:hypothetical protein GE09DRAFT_1279251 [Coniochaeta sp. 2T2.1]
MMITCLRHRPILASLLSVSARRWISVSADSSSKSYKITSILLNHDSTADKKTVLESLLAPERRNVKAKQDALITTQKPFDAALVLTTPGLTSWLDDEGFMVTLLRMTGLDPDGAHTRNLNVLSAVVDGLVLPQSRKEKRIKELGADLLTGKKRMGLPAGLAVVQGYQDELLPGLWEAAAARKGWKADDADGKAALVFRLPGKTFANRQVVPVTHSQIDVTVPVANTVFQNGRVSTLFASRWEGGGDLGGWAQMREVQRVNVGSQVVQVPGATDAEEKGVLAVRADVPLIAITPARTVGTALGNILKTFDVEGEMVPASRRLEEVVPKLLESRRRMGLGGIRGPLKVWALVVPARLTGEDKPRVTFRGLGLGTVSYPNHLLAAGCRLHRVLSGGGGWGAKQGLLSLDPETRFETTEAEDIESFERDFMAGREGGTGGGSVVGPGDQVVFCVDAGIYPKPTRVLSGIKNIQTAKSTQPFVVRVRPEETGGEEEVQTARCLGDEDVVLQADGSFGVVAKAMFLAPTDGPFDDGSGMAASVKVDTPGAELRVREAPSVAGEKARKAILRAETMVRMTKRMLEETAAESGVLRPETDTAADGGAQSSDLQDDVPASSKKRRDLKPDFEDFDGFVHEWESRWSRFLNRLGRRKVRNFGKGSKRRNKTEGKTES